MAEARTRSPISMVFVDSPKNVLVKGSASESISIVIVVVGVKEAPDCRLSAVAETIDCMEDTKRVMLEDGSRSMARPDTLLSTAATTESRPEYPGKVREFCTAIELSISEDFPPIEVKVISDEGTPIITTSESLAWNVEVYGTAVESSVEVNVTVGLEGLCKGIEVAFIVELTGSARRESEGICTMEGPEEVVSRAATDGADGMFPDTKEKLSELLEGSTRPISIVSVRLPENSLVYSVASGGISLIVVVVLRAGRDDANGELTPISTVSRTLPVNVEVFAGVPGPSGRVTVVVPRAKALAAMLDTRWPTSTVSIEEPGNLLVYTGMSSDKVRVMVIVLRRNEPRLDGLVAMGISLEASRPISIVSVRGPPIVLVYSVASLGKKRVVVMVLRREAFGDGIISPPLVTIDVR